MSVFYVDTPALMLSTTSSLLVEAETNTTEPTWLPSMALKDVSCVFVSATTRRVTRR